MRCIFLLLVLTACPRPAPPVPPQPPLPEGIEACTADSLAITEDICDGLFTPDGFACTVCPAVSGCIDTAVQIYCVSGSCLTDPLCRSR